MSAIITFIEKYYLKFFGFSVLYFFIGHLLFPAIANLVIYKNNFIYLLASSPLIGNYSIWGFNFFISIIVFTIIWQIKENL